MITFYEYPKCSTCQRAKAELQSLLAQDQWQAIDIKARPPRAEQLIQWMNQGKFTLKQFFNTSGNSYRQLGLKDKIDDLTIEQASKLLALDGMLIKRPLLVQGDTLLQIGYRSPYQALSLTD
ncbi:arsenate reductase family protein [Streptococcus halichoeri]|uniref:arsenate reductase family protein n=1 Tax=Streptococcus halichoeri TaxID=254785 RepID=UPI00135954D5|nr:arsenate reductase family protein [Streptococcus halichoeri]